MLYCIDIGRESFSKSTCALSQLWKNKNPKGGKTAGLSSKLQLRSDVLIDALLLKNKNFEISTKQAKCPSCSCSEGYRTVSTAVHHSV